MKKTVPFMLVLLIALNACGGDDGGGEENNNTGGTGDTGGTSGTGSGGTSGAGAGGSGGGGMGGAGGSGGSPVGPVTCGSTMCEQPGAMGFITACCAGEAMDMCGISILNGACMMTPESDERCPSIDVGGVFEIASCCTDDNLCGINAALLSMGCIDLESAAEGGMGMGMMGIDFDLPPPQTCDGMLIDAVSGDDDDAGM